MKKSTESIIEEIALKHFEKVGFATLTNPHALDFYKNWLDHGRHGELHYLQRHLPLKEDPRKLLPKAKSWISLLTYYDTQEPLSFSIKDELKENKQGWISRYARGEDYHSLIHKKHLDVIAELKSVFENDDFLSSVDSKPVLERDIAQRAGLGWIGKNTCLINQDLGSFVFISEILTTLELIPSKPVADHCGTCTRCIDVCPTQAIEKPYQLNPEKCISYWTIEVNKEPPLTIAKKFNNNVFGCDLCQDVCPWNQKARKQNQLPASEESGIISLKELIELPILEIEQTLKMKALNRAKPEHLKRNAQKILEAQP